MPNRADVSRTDSVVGESAYKEADVHIENFELTEARSGDIKWTLHAERALLFRRFDLGVLSDIDGELVESKHQVKLTGREGYVFISDKSLLLVDGVKAITEEGYRLLTDYLWYDGKKQYIRTASTVNVSGPNPDEPVIVLSGQGLISSIEKQNHEILSRVKAHQNFQNEPTMFISSDSGGINIEDKLATFKKDVVISKGELKITSDKFRIKFLGNRDIEWASATGSVHISDGDWNGTCKEAILFGKDKFVQLRGGAILKKGDDVVRGEMITLDRVKKRIIIEKVSAELSPPKGI